MTLDCKINLSSDCFSPGYFTIDRSLRQIGDRCVDVARALFADTKNYFTYIQPNRGIRVPCIVGTRFWVPGSKVGTEWPSSDGSQSPLQPCYYLRIVPKHMRLEVAKQLGHSDEL